MKSNSSITIFRKFLRNRFVTCRVQFKDILRVVQAAFPNLCNDKRLCVHESPRRPEWEHQVRHALDYMKRKEKVVSQQIRGEYLFL